MTTGSAVSYYYRVWFRRHFFQYAGFRYVRSVNTTPIRLCKADIFLLGEGVPGIFRENGCA